MAKQGKKQRKFGRHNRTNSGKYYNLSNRWKTNAMKRQEKEKKFQTKKKAKWATGKNPKRGTARAKRRKDLQK